MVITHKPPWVSGERMMVGVAKRGDDHQDRTDAGEQDVGAVGIGVEAELAAQAAQP